MKNILDCKICGSTDQQFVFRAEDHFTGKLFSLVRCCECGIIFTNPRPTSAELGQYYPPSYYGENGRRFSPFIEKIVHYFRQQLANRIASRYPSGGRILEVGSGRGTLLLEMARKGWSAVGTEYSPTLARSVEETLSVMVYPTPELVECHFPADYFDVVVCYHVLEHLPDPLGTLTEIRRIMRSSGLLIIAVPNIGSLIARISKEHWLGVDAPRHLFHFTPETLRLALSRTGFDEQYISTLSLEQDVFGFAQSMMNLLGLPYNIFYDFIRSPAAKMRHEIKGSSFQRIFQSASILMIGGVLSLVGLPVALASSGLGAGGTIECWCGPST